MKTVFFVRHQLLELLFPLRISNFEEKNSRDLVENLIQSVTFVLLNYKASFAKDAIKDKKFPLRGQLIKFKLTSVL